MEAQEEATATATTVVKGKRTKRQRLQSPVPFANLTAHSSSSDGDGDGDGDVQFTNGKISTNVSPTTSQEFQDSTQEEEDMANCLILLAQGHSNNNNKQDDNEVAGVYNPTIAAAATTSKFNSRRFLETGCPGSGKVGYYVYECKTCNRAFPSFQALGGHRASHKKPKNDEKKQFAIFSDEEDGHLRDISSLSLQLSNNNNNNNRGMYSSSNQNKNKIHECSICGAEFTSGQALGGHMRRHRTPIGANSSKTLSLPHVGIESEEPKKARNQLSLDLDLNLPAPEDEIFSIASKQQKQPKTQQQQQQQQKPSLVFSRPALVDCHY